MSRLGFWTLNIWPLSCEVSGGGVALQVTQTEAQIVRNRQGADLVALFYPFYVTLTCPICKMVAVWLLYPNGRGPYSPFFSRAAIRLTSST